MGTKLSTEVSTHSLGLLVVTTLLQMIGTRKTVWGTLALTETFQCATYNRESLFCSSSVNGHTFYLCHRQDCFWPPDC